MRINDWLHVSGEVRAVVFDGEAGTSDAFAYLAGEPSNAVVVHDTIVHNLVSNIGRQQMTKLIVNETTARVAYLALSTSAITPAVTDLTLPSELIRQPISVIQSSLTYYQLYSAYFATGDFSSTGIAAAALNDTVTTGGNQWADATVSISKSTAQSATVQWTIFLSS